jgi:hypothetical protein
MDLELDINSASQDLHHKDSKREPDDPEPMDNFVVPTGVWSDGTPDRM